GESDQACAFHHKPLLASRRIRGRAQARRTLSCPGAFHSRKFGSVLIPCVDYNEQSTPPTPPAGLSSLRVVGGCDRSLSGVNHTPAMKCVKGDFRPLLPFLVAATLKKAHRTQRRSGCRGGQQIVELRTTLRIDAHDFSTQNCCARRESTAD